MLPGLSDRYTTTSPLGIGMDMYHLGLLLMGLIMGKCGYELVDEFLEFLYDKPQRDLALIDLMALLLAPKEDDRISAPEVLKVNLF